MANSETGPLAVANLGLKFLLELVAFAALGYWGATVSSGAVAVLLAVAAPAAAIVLWARLAAPRAARRLPLLKRIGFELTVFALASIALATAGLPLAAAALLLVVIANSILLTILHQWDE